jgi:hypothetical protein
MTTKLWDQFWTEWLSQSSREALSWAFSRQSGAKGQTPAVTATDLLVGIWLSHDISMNCCGLKGALRLTRRLKGPGV